jgi:hypothetical protein
MTPQATIARLIACAVMLGVAHVASAERLQAAMVAPAPVPMRGWGPMIEIRAAIVEPDVTLVVVGNTSMKDETAICADSVLGCGYGPGPKRVVLPWRFRRAGEGVAFTIFGADVAVQRNGFKVVKSVTF